MSRPTREEMRNVPRYLAAHISRVAARTPEEMERAAFSPDVDIVRVVVESGRADVLDPALEREFKERCAIGVRGGVIPAPPFQARGVNRERGDRNPRAGRPSPPARRRPFGGSRASPARRPPSPGRSPEPSSFLFSKKMTAAKGFNPPCSQRVVRGRLPALDRLFATAFLNRDARTAHRPVRPARRGVGPRGGRGGGRRDRLGREAGASGWKGRMSRWGDREEGLAGKAGGERRDFGRLRYPSLGPDVASGPHLGRRWPGRRFG